MFQDIQPFGVYPKYTGSFLTTTLLWEMMWGSTDFFVLFYMDDMPSIAIWQYMHMYHMHAYTW